MLVFILGLLFSFCKGDPIECKFDWVTGNTTIDLSSRMYCDKSEYLTMNYSGYSSTFTPTYQIYNAEYDVDGVVGYRPEDETIYVVFRGTQSVQNWIDDAHVDKIDYYNSCGVCESCLVHDGFFMAERSIMNNTVSEVYRLRELFPMYDVIVTGHSLGAALGTLFCADLVCSGIMARLFVFGSPRVFNSYGAKYINSIMRMDSVHVSHYKDIVPHTPPTSMQYIHISGEWYEDEYGYIRNCDGGEDELCSSQWLARDGLNANDHMWYIGVSVSCFM